ncbi:MAG: GxxExxY protein [Puniceicoccales bacterium]
MPEIVFKEESYQIIGACMEVYNELGHGFLEMVYQEALALEFGLRGIPFEREKPLPVNYKGQPLGTAYRADFVCNEAIILEVKAMDEISSKNASQVLNYLNATRSTLGLLVNFGSSEGLQYKRFVNN